MGTAWSVPPGHHHAAAAWVGGGWASLHFLGEIQELKTCWGSWSRSSLSLFQASVCLFRVVPKRSWGSGADLPISHHLGRSALGPRPWMATALVFVSWGKEGLGPYMTLPWAFVSVIHHSQVTLHVPDIPVCVTDNVPGPRKLFQGSGCT